MGRATLTYLEVGAVLDRGTEEGRFLLGEGDWFRHFFWFLSGLKSVSVANEVGEERRTASAISGTDL